MDDAPNYKTEEVKGMPDIEAIKEDPGVQIPL